VALTTRTRKSENSKEFRNFYGVFYRVPAHGVLLIKLAELMLFYTGADTRTEYGDSAGLIRAELAFVRPLTCPLPACLKLVPVPLCPLRLHLVLTSVDR